MLILFQQFQETIPSTEVILREVDLPVFNHELCAHIYYFVTPRQLCLGGTPQGGTSACFVSYFFNISYKLIIEKKKCIREILEALLFKMGYNMH